MVAQQRVFRCTWGLTREDWDNKRSQMRALLVGIAESRATITYGEISQIVFAGRFSARSFGLIQMLDEVCILEDAERGATLASVVVRADSGIPGKGFFLIANDQPGNSHDFSDAASRRRFWQQAVEHTWDVYNIRKDPALLGVEQDRLQKPR